MRFVLGSIVLLFVGCGLQSDLPQAAVAPPIEQATDASTEEPMPISAGRLWLDEDAATMIEAVLDNSGSDHQVTVIRWDKVKPKGWAKLAAAEPSDPVVYDLSFESDDPDIDFASGWIVIAMRQQSKETHEWNVRITQLFKIRTGQQLGQIVDRHEGTLVRQPRVTDLGNQGDSEIRFDTDYIALKKYEDGNPVSWLELKLRP